jgi:hypothetical protein
VLAAERRGEADYQEKLLSFALSGLKEATAGFVSVGRAVSDDETNEWLAGDEAQFPLPLSHARSWARPKSAYPAERARARARIDAISAGPSLIRGRALVYPPDSLRRLLYADFGANLLATHQPLADRAVRLESDRRLDQSRLLSWEVRLRASVWVCLAHYTSLRQRL